MRSEAPKDTFPGETLCSYSELPIRSLRYGRFEKAIVLEPQPSRNPGGSEWLETQGIRFTSVGEHNQESIRQFIAEVEEMDAKVEP